MQHSENTYIEPSAVINISARGDIANGNTPIVIKSNSNNGVNASMHAGLSPSLWGSPAAGSTMNGTTMLSSSQTTTSTGSTQITMNKTTNNVNITKNNIKKQYLSSSSTAGGTNAIVVKFKTVSRPSVDNGFICLQCSDMSNRTLSCICILPQVEYLNGVWMFKEYSIRYYSPCA